MSLTNNLFQLSFPDGWRETTVYTFEGPFDSGVQHNLVVIVDSSIDKKTELRDYVKLQLSVSKESLPGFEMINERDVRLPSGLPAREIVYKYVPSDDQTLFQKQLYTIVGGKAYTFTSTFSKKTLQTIANDVDRIIASFKPLAAREE
jgi:hypothetical protein